MKKDHIDDYFHFGELLLAKSAAEKALLMYERKERRECLVHVLQLALLVQARSRSV